MTEPTEAGDDPVEQAARRFLLFLGLYVGAHLCWWIPGYGRMYSDIFSIVEWGWFFCFWLPLPTAAIIIARAFTQPKDKSFEGPKVASYLFVIVCCFLVSYQLLCAAMLSIT